MTILYIDTKDRKIIRVSLKEDGKSLPAGRQVIGEMTEENEYGSQVLLPLIMKLLRTVNPDPRLSSGSRILDGKYHRDYELKTLQGIEVETGPGSFTGLRVGVSVANALGFSLGIPVNGKKIESDLIY